MSGQYMLRFQKSMEQTPRAGTGQIFPYRAVQGTLPNGLKTIVIPLDSPGLVTYWSIVRTGSRDEVEPGRSGFAHFFEHMMFRGTEKYPGPVYDQIVTALGADSNAYTTDDYTAYHMTFAKEDLERVVEIESDRFQNLSYQKPEFQTEAGAVYGEDRKGITHPLSLLDEKLRDLAFDVHTYKHTTIGVEADIKAMPEAYEYSLSFFRRFYRPDNVVILVVGDVEPATAVELVRKYYAPWEKQRLEKALEVEFCLVPKTHIGYIAVRNYFNRDFPAQISTAIHKMSAKAPLDGLILDNRSNDGGYGDREKAILALFTKGEQGQAVGIDWQDVWNITSPVNVDGSQSVPMVVLVDEGSASGGEMIAGMLQNSHRAIVVGKQTRGTTGALELFSIADGSKLYLYTAAFQPAGGEVGQWEKKGITPDVVVPADWNQYSEANDPMLAKAVELLLKK